MKTPILPDHPDSAAEYAHLQDTRDLIDAEIREMETLTGAKAGEVMDVRMRETEDVQEEVAVQLFRNQLDRLRQLNMSAGQAYFARLDFLPEDGTAGTWYLGRWGVLSSKDLKVAVVDWRSPIANLYYSGQIGKMDYEAPDGKVRGELTLKRMLTVKDRELTALFDSGIVSQESYLQSVLGSVSTDRLKEIVTTIQAEQNCVIRTGLHRDLMVQGAAGSGKTTIALHRIAYLLYTYREVLHPENMMILAPNPLFLSYISQVLPDLGVERVIQTTFEGWCRSCAGKRIPPVLRDALLEDNLRTSPEKRSRTGATVRRKGSLKHMHELSGYLDRLQHCMIPAEGFMIGKYVLMDRAEAENVFLIQLQYFPLTKRIDELKKYIRKRADGLSAKLKETYAAMTEDKLNRLLTLLPDGNERREKAKRLFESRDRRFGEIDERITSYLSHFAELFPALDLCGVYEGFLSSLDDHELLAETMNYLRTGRLRQEDLPAAAMICKALYGLKIRPMKHIVIDECQDCSPFMIALLREANPAATFTLVGDLCQGIHADEGIRSWNEWADPVFSGRADMAQLTVSYRNTTEIMTFAQKISAHYPIEGVLPARPVLRHGEEPVIIRTDNEGERIKQITEQIRIWQTEGYHSVALIEKTADQAAALYRVLKKTTDVRLMTEKDTDYSGGILVIPSALVKGMEFDCVAVCDASENAFPEDEFLCRVLYVAATRALHRLRIWCAGKPSPMLPGTM